MTGLVTVVALACGGLALVAGPVPRSAPRQPPAWADGPPVPGPRVVGAVAAAALALVGLTAGSPLLVGPGAVTAGVGGLVYGAVTTRRRARRRRLEVLDLVDAMARSVRSGASLTSALAEATRSAAGTGLAPELRDLEARLRSGRPLPVALDQWSGRLGDPDLRLLAGTVAVLAAAGGAAAPALDAASATVRARAAAAAEVRAMAAQATASAVVLVAAPAVFAVVLAAVDPRLGHLLLHEPAGAACVAIALALDGAGLWWMQRIIDGSDR